MKFEPKFMNILMKLIERDTHKSLKYIFFKGLPSMNIYYKLILIN